MKANHLSRSSLVIIAVLIVGLSSQVVVHANHFDPTDNGERQTWEATTQAPSAPAKVRQCPGINLLVSQGQGSGSYYYGGAEWTNMTAAIDAVASSVTVAADLEDLATMLTFDALWVDQRWTDGSLTATEVSNIAAFIATGRRVVMIGENSAWTDWNNQILGIVGGSYAGGQVGSILNTVYSHELTTGVAQVDVGGAAGVAVGGTALFDENAFTLWGAEESVLTILDVNAAGTYWASVDNAIFFQNVAAWVACDEYPVELQSFTIE